MQENIFYSREEKENGEIVIVWKPYSTYGVLAYIIIAGVFYFINRYFDSFALSAVGFIPIVALIINAVLYMAKTQGVSAEIRAAQQEGNCRIEGNKYSFTSPLTVYIKK